MLTCLYNDERFKVFRQQSETVNQLLLPSLLPECAYSMHIFRPSLGRCEQCFSNICTSSFAMTFTLIAGAKTPPNVHFSALNEQDVNEAKVNSMENCVQLK